MDLGGFGWGPRCKMRRSRTEPPLCPYQKLISLRDSRRGTSRLKNTLFWSISGYVAATAILVMSFRIERDSRHLILRLFQKIAIFSFFIQNTPFLPLLTSSLPLYTSL